MNRNIDSNESNQANRDPITREPGSHPVGTGVGAAAGGVAGAAAGGAAGAAAGGVGGPVGVGVGAVAGAVVGGLGGKATAEHFNPTDSDMQRYLDYTVVDRDNDKVGSVDAVWEDHTGQPAYIAVKTGWLGLGKAHVVPAHAAEVSDATRKIRLPYSAEAIKNAPSFEQQSDIDDAAESSIASYYRQHGFAGWNPDEGRDRDRDDVAGRSEARRSTDDEVRMPLSEEHLEVGKREVEAGGVRLRKIIRTETVNRPVELQREEIVVERVPATGRQPTRTDVAFREEEIYIPLRREEAVIEKTARTTEEVRVGKKRETERREVSETLRKEEVDIQRQGEAGNSPSTPKPRR
jgi:uncharacterized protein (TIGR02271 family)